MRLWAIAGRLWRDIPVLHAVEHQIVYITGKPIGIGVIGVNNA